MAIFARCFAVFIILWVLFFFLIWGWLWSGAHALPAGLLFGGVMAIGSSVLFGLIDETLFQHGQI